MNNSYICKIIVAPVVFIIFGCDQRHDDYIGKDIGNIMQSVTDDGYMVVWPRVRMDIFEKC